MEDTQKLIITDLVFPILRDLFLPKVINIFKNLSSDILKKIQTDFEAYLVNRYIKYSYIETIVFPNMQTEFDVLYEPLTLGTEDINRKKYLVKINKMPIYLFQKYQRIIIEDTAGMGKSTVIKKLFKLIVEDKSSIPILLELRQVNAANDLVSEIQKQISSLVKVIDKDVILKLISQGGFIFLFDGFDEVPFKDREFVTKEVHKFIEKANENIFIITSRPEDSLTSFSSFQKFNIESLTRKESFSLIKRYDKYSYKPISKELIGKLGEDANDFDEFLHTPLLVCLLYKSFEYKKDIPIKKTLFYRQVYDALFETHDLSKEGYFVREKHCALHIDDFEKVLRYIGYFTAIKNKSEYDKNYILKVINDVKQYFPDLNFRASDFIKDLLETVPLFRKDGNYFKWSHRSFQDYFAARFISIDSKQNQDIILKKLYTPNKLSQFYNLLILFSELDSQGFERVIVYTFLKDIEKYSDNTYNKFDKSLKSVQRRITNTFLVDSQIIVTEKDTFKQIKQENASGMSEMYSKYISINYGQINYSYVEEIEAVILSYIKIKHDKYAMCRLLKELNSPIVNEHKREVYFHDVPFLKRSICYNLNDNPDNIINTKELFDLITESISVDYEINFEKSFKKLKAIEGQISLNLENEMLNF